MSDVLHPDQFYEQQQLPIFDPAKTPQMHATHRDQGRVGERTHITLNEKGTMPTHMIAELPGVMGEVPGTHRNKRGGPWDTFKDDIAQHGIQHPIFITVDYDEGPKISEGNHRRDAAVELGMPHVPVEVRYFGHAEQQGTLAQRNRPFTER